MVLLIVFQTCMMGTEIGSHQGLNPFLTGVELDILV